MINVTGASWASTTSSAMPQGQEEAAVEPTATCSAEQISKPPELAPRGGVWFRGPDIEFHLGVEDGFRPAFKAHPAFMVEDSITC